jgi:uridine kinase
MALDVWPIGERHSDAAVLRRNSLLAPLVADDVVALLQHLEIVAVAPGMTPLPDATMDALWFVLEGRIRVMRTGAEEVELLPGSDFGALSLAAVGAQPTRILALTAARLARLTHRQFEALARVRPSAAFDLSRSLLARIGRELLELRVRTEESARHAGGVTGAAASTGCEVRAADLVAREVDGALVVAAMLDRQAIPLDRMLPADAPVTPITTRTWEGREIYRRTAGLVLLEAARLIACGPVQLGPSITSARVVLVAGGTDPVALADQLGRTMRDLIGRDLPVREERWNLERAIEAFSRQGSEDAVKLLAFWQEPVVSVAICGGVVALSPGPMLPRTGMLGDVNVLPHPQGLVLDFGSVIRRELPKVPSSTRVMELRAPRYGADMTRLGQGWLEAMGTTSVGRFNEACVSGKVKELIHVSEGFHEKRFAIIADEIKRRDDVRIIAIAGPSSSGKTTFIKRLKVQLQVNGLRPVELSLDDYYVDRERSPRDATGAYDFEVIEALDRRLLDDQVRRLLAGEPVSVARFDFALGKSRPDAGPRTSLGPSGVLLVEGIHALNPTLLESTSARQTFKIFVHPATAISFDHLSIFEPADVRLLRRIVRDRHQRACPAADNLARWPSVRRAERVHIFPFQGEADAVFDTSLAYEVSVLRIYAERYLLEVPRAHPEFSAAYRLRHLLSSWVPIHPDHVPPTSILREFIGGSGFSY